MKKIMWIVAMIPVVVTSVVLQFMPDIIPMHHDLEGNTDRWGSKTESFIFPVIILFITLFCKGIMCCRNFASNHVRDYALFYSLFFLDTGKCRWWTCGYWHCKSFMYFVWYYIYCIRKFYDKGKTKCSSGSSNRLEYAQW